MIRKTVSSVADPARVETLVRERTAELMRDNEALREDIRLLRRQNAELARSLAETQASRQTDRESRRAALNLMEDALSARLAEQRENIERRRVEEELRKADRHKDEFLATLSHE